MNFSSPADEPSGPRRHLGPLALLAAFVLVFLWDAFLAGRTFVMRDTVCDFLPWRRLAAQALREGRLPLWNSWSRLGQPFVANPQSAVFYPPHLLYAALPVATAFHVNLALHLFLAAAGTYGLLRRLRASTEAALCAALVFAFGTYFVANLEFMSVMDTLAWAPLTILLVCRAGDAWTEERSPRRMLRPVVLLALVVTMQLLAGQLQVLGFTAIAALGYGVTLAVAEGRRAAAAASVASLIAASALAAGLALVQILPTMELVPLSTRAGAVDPEAGIASMAPRHLTTWILPFAFGQPGADRWWGTTLFDFWLGCVHIGLPALVLVTFAALRRKGEGAPRRAFAAVSAALVVVGVLVAMGKYTPVYGWLQTLPGFAKFRWPAKGLQLAAIGLAVLTGLGFDTLLRRREAARGRADGPTLVLLGAWTAAALLLLAVAGRDLFAWLNGGSLPPEVGDAPFQVHDLHRSVLFLLLGVAALAAAALRTGTRRVASAAVLVVVFGNLFVLSRDVQWVGDNSLLTLPPPELGPEGSTPGRVHTAYSDQQALYGARDPASYRLAASLLTGEMSLPYGVFKTYGGDALQVASAREITESLVPLGPGMRNRLLDVLAADRAVSGPPFAELLGHPDTDIPRVAPRPTPLPRAYLVERWEAIADRTAAMNRLLAPGFDRLHDAIEDPTSGAPPLPAPVAATAGGPPGRVVAVRYGWDRVDVDVETTRPCVLVLCDTWFPGWIARADGDERPIRRMNAIFRGVPLAAGARRVEFTYEPSSFRNGAIGSALALLVTAAAWLWGRRRAA